MLNFRKVSADSDGSEIRRYLTQDEPEPDPIKAIDAGGKLLESGEKLTQYYTGRGARASWRPDMPAAVAAAIGLPDARQQPRDVELDRLFEARRADNSAMVTTCTRGVSALLGIAASASEARSTRRMRACIKDSSTSAVRP